MTEDLGLELRLQFLDEALVCLRPLDSKLLGEISQSNGAALQLSLRAMHSIKAGAGMMGFANLSKLTHRFEDLLVKLGNPQRLQHNAQQEQYSTQSDLEIGSLLLAGVDGLRQIICRDRNQLVMGETLNAEQQTDWLEAGVYNIFDQLQHYLKTHAVTELPHENEQPIDAATVLNPPVHAAEDTAGNPAANTTVGQPSPTPPEFIARLFETEVEASLQQLETAIAELSPVELKQELTNQTQALADLAQILQLESLNQLCASIMQALTSSQDIQSVAHRALEAWRQTQSIMLTQSNAPLPTDLKPSSSSAISINTTRPLDSLRVSMQSINQCQTLAAGLTQTSQTLASALDELHHLTDSLQQQICDLNRSNSPADSSVDNQIDNPTNVEVSMPQLFTSGLPAIADQFAHWIDSTDQLAEELHHLSQQLHLQLMQLHMRPFSDILSHWLQALENLCNQYGKSARLNIQGGDTWISSELLNQLKDPLTHLFRNAFDHGIEPPAARLAQGKPEQGVISIHVQSDSQQLQIQFGDDGQGIAIADLRQVAKSKGQSLPNDATDEQLLSLIFEPGFSTKSQVTDLSGRGVGMDIVRDRIQQLGGTITIETYHGQGTTFTISIPLT